VHYMTAETPVQTDRSDQTLYEYKRWVEKIVSLPFEDLGSRELVQVCYLSWVSAVEFAEALRLAQDAYGDHAGLQEMIEGELQTDNLSYGDYSRAGDHFEFLAHFLDKQGGRGEFDAELGDVAAEYLAACQALPPHIRAMSVFSREEELSRIFERVLDAPEERWDLPVLGAYRYYLQRHIELDSEEGGHADLISDIAVDDHVAPFYHARFRLYRKLPTFAASHAYDVEH
jgi:Protein of unknown function (DUF3050)